MSKFGCETQKSNLSAPNNDNNASKASVNKSYNPKNKKKSTKKDIYLTETDRILLQQTINDFLYCSEVELVIERLTKSQRKYTHEYSRRLGFATRSYSRGNNRILYVYKRERETLLKDGRALVLSTSTAALLNSLVSKIQEQQKTMKFNNGNRFISSSSAQRIMHSEALILLGPRCVPRMPHSVSEELLRDKQELPIFQYQSDILQILQQHNVFIINGETGSGKTTQVPQYILNEAAYGNIPCRVVVTQPRRVAAVSMAHRVAEERGEVVGDTVGYQIRMESRMHKNTNLIYTTSGCLLRAIMANVDDVFRKVSHLIIDEIHERDKNTDFTLITIKEHLRRNKSMKVILMSATMDIKLLSQYFDDCPILNVPGQSYDVKIYHLDDILFHTGYRTALMEKYLRSLDDMQLHNVTTGPLMAGQHNNRSTSDSSDVGLQSVIDVLLMNCCTPNCSLETMKDSFDQMQYYVESESMAPDVTQSMTGVTPLMAACKCNMPDYVRFFIAHGANINARDNDGFEAIDYARLHSDNTCVQILTSSFNNMQMVQQQYQQYEIRQHEREKQRLLSAYQMQFNDDDDVDHDLILSLLEGLYRSTYPGAIIVFLPGYNDIIKQRDLIQSTLPFGTYSVIILHGQMESKDQFEALQSQAVRKIILSTNIGQTSITIPDLAYVIDSGKVKMNTFDSMTESSQLRCVWISKADACQRSGRAGRTQNGICYRLYSERKYYGMSCFSIPEFMRIALTEICLYAKVLDPERKVQDYLARALSPPSSLSVSNALKKLMILGVLNDDESITQLGRHLVDIPLDVQLGKCLLYAAFFKCLDPILTICAYHSVKDPFILPTDRSIQGQASFLRKSFACDSFSDQMGVLNLYKQYMTVRHIPHKARHFCNTHFLSQSSMEMFCSIRKQIAEVMKQKFVDCRTHNDFNHNNWIIIQMCLVSGFYPNVVALDRANCKLVCGSEKQLVLQRTSALTPPGKKHLKEFIHTLPHDWIVFYEKSRLSNVCSINMNTMVPPLLIALQCGRSCEVEYDNESADESVDDDEDADVYGDGDFDDATNDAVDGVGVRVGVGVGNIENYGTDNNANANGNKSVKIQDQEAASTSDQNAAEIQLLKSLKDVSIRDTKSDAMAIMSLDNWIKFSMKASHAKAILIVRDELENEFQIYLRNGHNRTTINTVQYVQELLDTLDTKNMATGFKCSNNINNCNNSTAGGGSGSGAGSGSGSGSGNVGGGSAGHGTTTHRNHNHHKTFNNQAAQ